MTNAVPNTTSSALHLLKPVPFLGDKKRKKKSKSKQEITKVYTMHSFEESVS